jgi:glycosyltransferase involved in cell wall biosynthesis
MFKKIKKDKREAGSQKILIGIDASRSAGLTQKTGVEFVSDALIQNFLQVEANFEKINFVFYTPKKIDFVPSGEQKILRLKKFWTIFRLSFEMLVNKPDVLFVPVHTLPFFTPQKTFKIIHDVAFLKNPELYSKFKRWQLTYDLKRCIRKCTKIFVPAETVKKDILNFYKEYDSRKIVVIPHGYFLEKQKTKSIDRKKQILYVGRIEEKKNVLNIILAFEKFNQKQTDYQLVLAGKAGHNFEKIKDKIETTKNVGWLGYVSENKKKELMSESEMMCFLSKEEGFGIPVLEAFAFEVPMIASDIDVLKEVGGRSCLYVDPENIEQIAHSFEKLATDAWLRDSLVQKGKKRVKQFNWQDSAHRYLEEISQF